MAPEIPNFNKRSQILPTLSRLSPLLFLLGFVTYATIMQNLLSIYLLISFGLISIANGFIKNGIIKPIFGVLGSRPTNANSCALLLNGINDGTYGMPSGHSQIAWAVCTYLALKVLLSHTDDTSRGSYYFKHMIKLLKVIAIISVAAYISYSRVTIEGCHTWMQVTVGGILGSVMGICVYSLEKLLFR